MSFKKWFGQRPKSAPDQYDIDDLLILERYAEAESQLKAKLRGKSGDLASRLKLAEVYLRTRRYREAVDEYLSIADRYAADGFFDKAIALLAKASKLAPSESKLRLKLKRLERIRQLEHRLSSVVRGLSRSEGQVGPAATASYFEFRKLWGEASIGHLIDHLNDEQLGRLLKAMEVTRLGRNKTLVSAGERREELYLLTQGRLDVTILLPNGESTVLRSLGQGDLVGDRALLEHLPWAATYVTAEPVVLLKLSREGLAGVLQGNPDPRTLLEALRGQHLDADIAAAVNKTYAT